MGQCNIVYPMRVSLDLLPEGAGLRGGRFRIPLLHSGVLEVMIQIPSAYDTVSSTGISGGVLNMSFLPAMAATYIMELSLSTASPLTPSRWPPFRFASGRTGVERRVSDTCRVHEHRSL